MADNLQKPDVALARWKAVVEYRSEAGIVDVEHAIAELDELHDLVERGPDWNALIKITVTLAHPTPDRLTIEKAARL